MNKKRDEMFASLKADFKKFFAFSDEKKFSDFVLSDSTKITTPAKDLEIGAELFKLDDMGNQTSLDPGEYVLNDGRIVTYDGKTITNIQGGDTTATESPVSDADTSNDGSSTEASKVKMEDGLTAKPSDESDLASRITDLESKLDELANLLKGLMEGQTQANEQMMSQINLIGDEPGDLPIRTLKRGYDGYADTNSKKAVRNTAIQELRISIEEKRQDKSFGGFKQK